VRVSFGILIPLQPDFYFYFGDALQNAKIFFPAGFHKWPFTLSWGSVRIFLRWYLFLWLQYLVSKEEFLFFNAPRGFWRSLGQRSHFICLDNFVDFLYVLINNLSFLKIHYHHPLDSSRFVSTKLSHWFSHEDSVVAAALPQGCIQSWQKGKLFDGHLGRYTIRHRLAWYLATGRGGDRFASCMYLFRESLLNWQLIIPAGLYASLLIDWLIDYHYATIKA